MLNKLKNKLVELDRKANIELQFKGQQLKDRNSEKGAGAVEYALVIAVVVTLVVGVAGVMKDPLDTFFQSAVAKVSEFLGG